MAGDFQSIMIEIDGENVRFNRAVDSSSTKLKGFETDVRTVGGSIEKLLSVGIPAAAAAGTVATAFSLAKQAAELQNLRTAYKGTETDLWLLRKATAGTVADADLLKLANQMGQLGIAAENQAILLSMAEDAGDSMGIGISEAMEKIIKATEGGTRGLYKIGIQAGNYNEILAELARSHGVEVSKLDAESQQLIRIEALLKATGMTMQDVINKSQDNADKLESMTVKWQTAKEGIGTFLLTLFDTTIGLDTFNRGIEEWLILMGKIPDAARKGSDVENIYNAYKDLTEAQLQATKTSALAAMTSVSLQVNTYKMLLDIKQKEIEVERDIMLQNRISWSARMDMLQEEQTALQNNLVSQQAIFKQHQITFQSLGNWDEIKKKFAKPDPKLNLGNDSKGAAAEAKQLSDLIQRYTQENELLRINDNYRELRRIQLEMEKELEANKGKSTTLTFLIEENAELKKNEFLLKQLYDLKKFINKEDATRLQSTKDNLFTGEADKTPKQLENKFIGGQDKWLADMQKMYALKDEEFSFYAQLYAKDTELANSWLADREANASYYHDLEMQRKWDEMEAAGQAFGYMADAMGMFYELSGSKSKELFMLNKAFSIGNAVMSTWEAADKALAQGGPFFGPALAAAIVAQGLANVARIASTQPGTSAAGGGSAAASSMPRLSNSYNQNTNNSRTANITINIHGVDQGSNADKYVRETLAPAINRAFNDGVINFGKN